jgi:molecular chaperone DnaK (HSP70)
VDFDSKQREATVQAFKNAGFFVARILEEPTAAAIAYGLHKDPSISFIIVFDFGGGTLDVSLLYARSGSINVVDTIGDNNLGGEDVDATIADYLAKHIAEQIGSPIKSIGSDMEEQDSERVEDPNELPCTRAGIRRAAELVKRKLSSTKNARAECIVQTDGKKKKTGDKITVELTREQLETFCANLFERTLVPVKEILEKNAMSQKDIDEVVLVGGSSRIPWIRENLKKLFGGRAPRSDIDPDVAVAYGAARTLD